MATFVNSHDFLDPPTQSGDMGVLGHYRVLDELGRGGMGFVFRAEDTKLKRSVALKVMNKKIAATPHSRRRFLHEARAMAAVHHDNVATIFEVGESNGTPFMAMEMLKGQTLEEFNQTKARLGFETIIEYARQVARGLAAAHANGIVHRDIKPANIWVEEGTERIKILDFGLALASTPVDHLAGRGAVIGTPGYLSPEQARSEPLDDRSDLYSLGVVLYELCTGQLPILSKSVSGQLISILAHRPKPIEEVNPEMPQPLCDLVHRLLRKEPRSRPSSAAALAEDLDRVETECHAKSEVAQAINKLQMGLSEVVSKKSSESLFDSVEEFEEIPDPLAAVPDSLAAAPATPVTMVHPARPAGKPAPAATKADWKHYWPFAAAGAAVLIVLPLLWLALGGGSGGDEVAGVPSSSSPSPSAASTIKTPAVTQTPQPTASTSQPGGNGSSEQNQQSQTGPKTRQGTTNRKGNKNKNQGKKNSGKGQQAKPGSPKPATDSKPDQSGKPSQEPGDASMVSKTTGRDSSPPPPKEDVAPTPTPTPAKPELVETTISTADGVGADARVERGGKERLGENPSIGILKRGKVEIAHSYLLFDLSRISEVIPYVKEAELVLTVVGRSWPAGATVRVVGIDVDQWPEMAIDWNNSFSASGLDSLPQLAEIKIGRDRDPRNEGQNLIRISSPELAQFIAGSPRKTVTFALAGSGIANNKALMFVSRNKSAKDAPRLIVKAPAAPPPDAKKKSKK